MFSLGNKDYFVLLMAIGLLALFSCGLISSHMMMGHGELCRIDGHLLPIFPSKESLFFGLILFALVFILLHTNTRQVRNLDSLENGYKSLFGSFEQGNNFSIFNPVSAFVLVRTVQRHVY